MMVYFRKRFSEEDLSRINELIAQGGNPMAIEAVSSLRNDNDSVDPGADAGTQMSLDDIGKPMKISQRERTGKHSPSMPLARKQTSLP
ncbi:hypothetical protein EBZ37_09925 [bacterium]|nr:hypothetical protein [bacterium]